jgi:hypothetical protein
VFSLPWKSLINEVLKRSDVHDILVLLKHISKKPDEDWPAIFSNIEDSNLKNGQATIGDPLVFIGPPPQSDHIKIQNNRDTSVRVVVTDSVGELPRFREIAQNGSEDWPITGNEFVFINVLGVDSNSIRNRVAIAMAEAGTYGIEKLA